MVEQFAPKLDHHRRVGQQSVSFWRAPGTIRRQTAAGDQTVDMNMPEQKLIPGMESRYDPGLCAAMFFVSHEIEKGIADGQKEQVGHGLDIVKPYVVEFMRNGEDHVIMVAAQESGLLFLQPSIHQNIGALGTQSVLTGVVPMPLEMAVRAALYMAAQSLGPACNNRLYGITDMGRQGMHFFIGFPAELHDLLNCGRGCVQFTFLSTPLIAAAMIKGRARETVGVYVKQQTFIQIHISLFDPCPRLQML